MYTSHVTGHDNVIICFLAYPKEFRCDQSKVWVGEWVVGKMTLVHDVMPSFSHNNKSLLRHFYSKTFNVSVIG